MSDVRQQGLLACEPLNGSTRGLRLIVELDLATVRYLKDACEGIPAGEGQVTLDLSELTFVDSTGLHALLLYARENDGDGPVIFANPSTFVLRVMQITELDTHPALEIRMDGDGR